MIRSFSKINAAMNEKRRHWMMAPLVNCLTLTCLVVVCACSSVGVADCQEQPVAAVEAPRPERLPYNVRLLVAFDRSAFDSNSSRSILQELGQAANRCVGELWSLKIEEIDWLGPASEQGLARLDRQLLSARFPEQEADVWFVATVGALPVGTRVSVRSWQPEIQQDTVAESADLQDRREIPIAILRLCRDLMRAVGIVERVDGQSVQIRLRAGELNPPDPSFAQVTKGDLMLPIFAYRNKHKVIERLQTVPWTYVSVEGWDGSTVMGKVQSGLRMSLGGKKRGRIDTFVVALRRQYPSTQLEMVTQSKPQMPLVAHRIEVRTSPVIPRPPKDSAEQDQPDTFLRELLTDRLGMSRVPVEPDHKLVWLFAYSGENLLVRVPCIPGIAPMMKLEVPDDSARLTAEADLQMLQGEVIDAVALRNTAIATIRAAAKKDDWTTVNQKLDLLKRQQHAGAFEDRLIAVRVAGTAASKARRDKVGEVRINRICDDTALLVRTHLGDEKVRLLVEEMQVLQSTSAPKEKQ